MRKNMLLIAVLASIAGCKAKAATNGGTATGGGDGDESATEQLASKQSAYVECLNDFTRNAGMGHHEWLDTFPKGVNTKQASAERLYAMMALNDPKKCIDGVKAAKTAAPSLPALEQAGDAYVAALSELQPMTVKLHDYFDQGNYKDDKLALAQQLEPKLLAAYDKFFAADDALSSEVDKLEDKLSADQLAELEKTEGKKLRWYHKRMLIESKKVVDLAGSVQTPFDMKDPAAFQAAITALDTHSQELLDYYTKNKPEIEDKQHITYWTMDSPIKEFVKASKAMMRRQRDKVAFTESELESIHGNMGESVDGAPQKVIKAYNDLISESNSMRL